MDYSNNYYLNEYHSTDNCYSESALKTRQLWNACYNDDSDQVKELTVNAGVDLNWKKPDMSVSA